jgi:hypothetical protein
MQFSTGKKPGIVDLGSLVDDPSNKTISIHNSCSSFGGDMIADDNGNLYVFSARNHVFKVNIESKVATHAGFISGLPATFTINGAAVTDKNQVIVASAIESGTCFTIDTKTWVATPYSVAGTVWHSSDLGNSNLLVSGNKPVVESPAIASRPSLPGSDNIQIFPNPVTNNKFSVQFSSMETGNYTIHVTDVMGREVVQQAVVLTGENQMQNINLTASASKGVYLVKVLDANKKTIYSTKIIVQ